MTGVQTCALRSVIVLNMRGSIAAKLVLVQKAEKNRFWTELLINTEYGPISVKSPRSDVKYLTLFIEDEKIVSQSLSLSLNAIKSSIVIKEYTHEKAIAYVYDLAITYGSEESPQIDPVQKLESKKDVKRLIKTKSIEIAKASQTRIAIVLNRRGSITGKLVIVPGARKGSFATELLIDTEYGPVSIKSPRAEVKHLVLFVENEKKIVASSLSLNIDRVKATIGFKRTSYRNAISYVYDLTIEQALSA